MWRDLEGMRRGKGAILGQEDLSPNVRSMGGCLHPYSEPGALCSSPEGSKLDLSSTQDQVRHRRASCPHVGHRTQDTG